MIISPVPTSPAIAAAHQLLDAEILAAQMEQEARDRYQALCDASRAYDAAYDNALRARHEANRRRAGLGR